MIDAFGPQSITKSFVALPQFGGTSGQYFVKLGDLGDFVVQKKQLK
jgi:hypothetical protein